MTGSNLVMRVIVFLFIIMCASPHSSHARSVITQAGDIGQFLPTAEALILLGYHKDWEGFKQFLVSSGSGAAVAYSLKYGLDVRRPNGGHHSFPSGHAWAAFNGAEFVRRRYGWKWGIPAYSIAGFTAYSRVEANAHRPEDVIASAGIAFLSNYFFTSRFENHPLVAKNNFTVTPSYHNNGTYLMFQFEW